MILYLDPSAWIKRWIQEDGTDIVRIAVADPAYDAVACARLGRIEMIATFARSWKRRKRLTKAKADRGRDEFFAMWDRVIEVDFSPQVQVRAEKLATLHALRGYDAVHLASALRFKADRYLTYESGNNRQAQWADLMGWSCRSPPLPNRPWTLAHDAAALTTPPLTPLQRNVNPTLGDIGGDAQSAARMRVPFEQNHPPVPLTAASLALGTWRSAGIGSPVLYETAAPPAKSPRNCRVASTSKNNPRMPGWHAERPPPSGFTGKSPPTRMRPFSTNDPPSPFAQNPRSSMVHISMNVNAS